MHRGEVLLLYIVKVKVTQSCLTLCDPMDYTVHGILQARIREWAGSLSLLQGIFPTQGSNPGLPHCRQILYQLSHKESPKILGWVAYPFSKGSSWPRNRTRVSCIVGGFFTNWAIREAPGSWKVYFNLFLGVPKHLMFVKDVYQLHFRGNLTVNLPWMDPV